MYLPQVLADNFSQQQENEIIIREKIREIVEKNGDLRKDLKRSFPFAGKAGPARIGIIENNLKKFPHGGIISDCLLYTSPSPRDRLLSRMPSSA